MLTSISKGKGIEIYEEHGSFDSVEGNENVGSFSARKRKCGLTTSTRSSKIQKLSAGTSSYSESLVKKGSSFMKWITNLMKGLSHDFDRKFLCENSHTPVVEHANNNLFGDTGLSRKGSFQSFFHAMYLRSHGKKLGSCDFLKGGKESRNIEETNWAPSGKNAEFIVQTTTVNPDKRSNACIGEVPSWSLAQPTQEKYKRNLEGNSIPCNIACRFENGSNFASNIAEKPVSDITNAVNPSEIARNNKFLVSNLWLSRFSRKQSVPSVKPVQENVFNLVMSSTGKAVGTAGGSAESGVATFTKPDI